MAMDIARRITTAQALLEAGDIGRCELVRGRLRVMTPASGMHGWVAARVAARLFRHVEATGCGVVLAAETGFLISRQPDSVRAPDAAFVAAGRAHLIPARGWVQGPPDLAVEVLSPDDRPADVEEKVADWLSSGTRAVWLVDPASKTVAVRRIGEAPLLLRAADVLEGGELVPGLEIDVSDVFPR
jgi:Uma2 family endonuclease